MRSEKSTPTDPVTGFVVGPPILHERFDGLYFDVEIETAYKTRQSVRVSVDEAERLKLRKRSGERVTIEHPLSDS